jgi:hypothetical protein
VPTGLDRLLRNGVEMVLRMVSGWCACRVVMLFENNDCAYPGRDSNHSTDPRLALQVCR